MTFQQTVNVTQDRRVLLDLPVPEDIPFGKTEVKIIFISPKNTLASTDKKLKAKLAFQKLQSYKKILPADFDYKKELEEVRNEKYEKYENSHRH